MFCAQFFQQRLSKGGREAGVGFRVDVSRSHFSIYSGLFSLLTFYRSAFVRVSELLPVFVTAYILRVTRVEQVCHTLLWNNFLC